MECKYCGNKNCKQFTEGVMCHYCWAENTTGGQAWWKDEQMRLWHEDQMCREIEEDYYRRQPHESPDQYLGE